MWVTASRFAACLPSPSWTSKPRVLAGEPGGRATLSEPLNKTMDRGDLERPAARAVVAELNELIGYLQRKGLRASSWYGTLGAPAQPWEEVNRGYGYEPLRGAPDDANFPWFLYWEIAWLVINNDFRPGERLLDLGGSSSLFSLYMASRGLDVTTVDLNRKLVANADRVAERTGWKLSNRVMDMRRLELPGRYDHVTSVCVLEHLPHAGRFEVNAAVGKLLRDGGSFSVTFDYLNPSHLARISSPDDIYAQIVVPSGLAVRGNERFHDGGARQLLSPFHHPSAWWRGWKLRRIWSGQFRWWELPRTRLRNDYTFGALFLEKRPSGG